MGNKLIDILMETDPEKLERNSTHDIEIKRLSRVFGAPFLVTVKAVPGERYSELYPDHPHLCGSDGQVSSAIHVPRTRPPELPL